jgi:hypothetical protein
MPFRKRIHATPGRLVAGAAFLAVMCTAAGTGAPGAAGAVQLAGYGSSIQATPPGAVPAPGGSLTTTYTFAISGKVSGLFPGKTLPLTLTLTNPNAFSITVSSLTTTVSNASATCLAANLKVTSFSGSFVVGAKSTGKVTVHATLVHSAPNACKGATFPLHYHGSATGA